MPRRRDPRTEEFEGTARFERIRRIGGGGMGVVYEVFDKERGLRTALKTMREPNPRNLLRFKNEFRSLAELHHPNLVQLGELIEEKGQWYFTMELVAGADFVRFVRPSAAPVDALAATPAETPVEFAHTATLPQSPPNQDVSGRSHSSLPPVEHAARYDEPRLRAAFAQLAEGLAALHAAGQVHRDIKPSNVLVTDGGRVVILDFGLVKEVASNATQVSSVAGTIAYMAPEQAAALRIGPSADWYSAGVMLYESLTGRLPYNDPMADVLLRRSGPPPPPRQLVRAVPTDLDDLCMELLSREPELRPSADEVLRRLRVKRHAVVPGTLSQTPLVGRTRELDQLKAAWARVQAGETRAILVHGETGIGKSALVRSFTESIVAEGGEKKPVILIGRCLGRETVPFRAVDGVVDGLSRLLGRWSEADVAAVLPRHAWSLARLFPVLRRVEAVAQAPAARQATRDPHERRQRAFAALRELLQRIADRRPIVILVENMQSTDADSLALLAEVLRPPEAPALLVIATLRSRWGSVGLEELQAALPCATETLPLGALDDEEARQLARGLVSDRAHADAIAKESAGHPLLLVEIARLPRDAGARPLKVDEALAERVRSLDSDARAVLELLALAGEPIGQSVAASAADLSRERFSAASSTLTRAQLAVESGPRPSDTIELVHDRLRDPVLADFDAEACRVRYRRLAETLEASGQVDLEALATHWLGAGEPLRAAYFYQRAAAQAFDGLAFERAANLYRCALELKPPTGEEGRALWQRLGESLHALGHGVEAAEAWQRAAEFSTGEPLTAIELRRRAAEHLLRGGHIDEGLALLRAVLRAVGVRFPRTRLGTIVGLLWRRAILRLRGLSVRVRAPEEISPERRARVDACGSASVGAPVVDPLLGAYFQARHLGLALSSGEPLALSRALCAEAVNAAAAGDGPRARLILAQAETMAERANRPEAIAQATMTRGIAAVLLGEFRRGAEESDRATALYREKSSELGWEIGTAQLFSLLSRAYLGELKLVAERWPQAAREARERGDLHAHITLRTGHAALVWLAADDAKRARQEIEEAQQSISARWSTQRDYYDLFAAAHVDLYLGDAHAALARLAEGWRALEKSYLLRLQFIRVIMIELRGRAALAAGDLDGAARDARRLADEKAEWAQALAALLEAGIAASQKKDARDFFRNAAKQLDTVAMGLHAAVARLRAGDGDHAPLSSQGIRDPARFAAMLAP